MSAIIRACAILARCWNGAAYTEIECTADDARELALSAKNQYDQLRADLAAVKDQCNRQEHGFARRENDLQRDLATALRESAEVIAQRDTALGLCKERERELAEARAERALARKLSGEYLRLYEAERAAHAETRKALDNAMSILSSRDEIAESALESTRAELARSEASAALAWQTHASAAKQLQDAEARVKQLEAGLPWDGIDV